MVACGFLMPRAEVRILQGQPSGRTKMGITFGRARKIGLNLLGFPKRKFKLRLDVTVGGDDLSDAVDSVCELLKDHAWELFKKTTPVKS